jgi:hypothetical protein
MRANTVKLIAVSTGRVAPLFNASPAHQSGVRSAIHKLSVSSLSHPEFVHVGRMGLEGDEQHEKPLHGGTDQALYAYPVEHFDFWTQLLLREKKSKPLLSHGSFGENLSIEGCLESEVFVGDRWSIGEVLLEVTKLREPCFKLNVKLNYSGAAKAMRQSGKSGWYLRVIQEGRIRAGESITVVRGPSNTSIEDQNRRLFSLSHPTQDLFD